jgi:hypothetical protein
MLPPRSQPASTPIPDLIYDLRLNEANSNVFYSDVSAFADKLLAEIAFRAGAAITGYGRYVQEILLEHPRTLGEYSIEYLTLGLLLSRYSLAAETTPRGVVALARELFWLRGRSPGLKPLADLMRTRLTRAFLVRRISREPLPCSDSASCRRTVPCGNSRHKERICPRYEPCYESNHAESISAAPSQSHAGQWRQALDGLPSLIEWLQASGEFEQEAMRLNNWRGFLYALPLAEAAHSIEMAAQLFQWFKREANAALGAYTAGVPRFLAGEYANRPCREDQVFCGKDPVEYHLCMVAAEIMNRGLRAEFERTTHKVVLVPACMRGPYASFCRASVRGADMQCAACSKDCAVNRLTRRMNSMGIKVYVVPHSKGFSRWLMRWQREPDTGVTTVACLLNILPGAYEMRARGIPSQCVPLDYPGCRTHWRGEEIATGFNQDRLVQIFASPRH